MYKKSLSKNYWCQNCEQKQWWKFLKINTVLTHKQNFYLELCLCTSMHLKNDKPPQQSRSSIVSHGAFKQYSVSLNVLPSLTERFIWATVNWLNSIDCKMNDDEGRKETDPKERRRWCTPTPQSPVKRSQGIRNVFVVWDKGEGGTLIQNDCF